MSKSSDYPLCEHWYQTMNWIMDRCDRMPKHTPFTVSGRIVQLSIDTAELISEAIYTRERQTLLLTVNRNLEKLRLYFRLSKDRQYTGVSQEVTSKLLPDLLIYNRSGHATTTCLH